MNKFFQIRWCGSSVSVTAFPFTLKGNEYQMSHIFCHYFSCTASQVSITFMFFFQITPYNSFYWNAFLNRTKMKLVRIVIQKHQQGTLHETRKDAQLGPCTALKHCISQWMPRMDYVNLYAFVKLLLNYTLHFSFTTVFERLTPLKRWILFPCKSKSTCVLQAVINLVIFATCNPTLDSASVIGMNTFCFSPKICCASAIFFLCVRFC